jgi:hypothetical protein
MIRPRYCPIIHCVISAYEFRKLPVAISSLPIVKSLPPLSVLASWSQRTYFCNKTSSSSFKRLMSSSVKKKYGFTIRSECFKKQCQHHLPMYLSTIGECLGSASTSDRIRFLAMSFRAISSCCFRRLTDCCNELEKLN